MYTNECGVVNKFFCQRSRVLFKHVSLWCFHFDPYLTTHQSIIGVPLRKVTKEHLHTLNKIGVEHIHLQSILNGSPYKML